ncbi:polysaccharide deacetylase family protein [Thermoactinospora rubra]|uniref:polysaccharide deacetylase family protein n=1 Tax=Thermoactinospora rubra TaxID=1088767 RepID=UPI00117F3A7C|nr:polysaccharide deacetylase family protein [Thermoactinospora rubra]
MHIKRFFGGIALLVAGLTGCGVTPPAPELDGPVPADPTRIPFVAPAAVQGLTPMTVTDENSAYVLYPHFADVPAFNRALRQEVDRQLTEFRERTRGSGLRSELTVEWRLAAFSPQVIGVRLRTGEFADGGWGHSLRTLWYDRGSGQAVPSKGLVKDLPAVKRLVLDQLLRRERIGDPGSGTRPLVTDEAMDSMAFNADGDLVVEFDDCQVAACAQGRVAVTVSAEQALPLLSRTGRLAQAAALRAALRPAVPPLAQTPATPSPSSAVPRFLAAPPSRAVDCATAKCVALTFEDGPGPHTADLLDILRKEHARATFFTVGLNAAADPDIVRRIHREGHVVANHTWAHLDLTKLSSSRVTDSLSRTQDALAAATGERPTLARPPYGNAGREAEAVAERLGLALVTWDVDAGDEHERAPCEIVRKVVGEAHAGAIVRMHEIHRTTVEAVAAILKELRRKGFELVTVPELYGDAGMRAGRVYSSGPLD